MEFTFKRTFAQLMLVVAFLLVGVAITSAPSLGLGQAAYAGEDGGCDDDDCGGGSGGSGSSDSGGSPSGGVNTGGGGTAGSGAPVVPMALGGLGAVVGGSLLVRRFVKQDG